MIIQDDKELAGMRAISTAVAQTLKQMLAYAAPGMSTKELDDFGGSILAQYGARSAPALVYKFPGHACISVNNEVCHGIPSDTRILQEGDVLNIDVSAELNGFYSDNGCSIIVGEDINQQQKLVEASKDILKKAIYAIKGGVLISDIGAMIEREAKKQGYKVIKNLGGHGIGRGLHEQPEAILNCKEPGDKRRFRKGSVVAIETFINTHSSWAEDLTDGFTMVGDKGGFAVQHEHTIIVTDGIPEILTLGNGVWD
ncbi:type I methionyl aminopeptidase [Sphingobacterium sp. MYb382]|uniref:type I methionyl aminopeptidase n=1 Tax=Sphingobacterium sp. MYb382 TaxID=2745278 RepID=UPI0030AAA5D1